MQSQTMDTRKVALASFIVAASMVSVLCIRPLREAAGRDLGAVAPGTGEPDGLGLREADAEG